MTTKLRSTLLLIGFTAVLSAQNNVGIGTNTPDPTAALEVTSPANNQGVLVPRLTTAQRTAIASPANGLLVYDTNVDCFFYYIAATSVWQSMCTAGTGATGPTGATGSAGATGATGANGTNGLNGISCWDLNGNSVNDPAEDINGDGNFDALDCAGAAGAQGPAGANGATGATGAAGANGANGTNGVHCWDTDGDGVNDPGEDTNSDGAWNTLDCVAGVVGPTGPTGVAGANGTTGPTGPAGTNGTNGTNGATGPTGPTGANGTNGTNGAAGATGPTGPTGAAGANGTNGTNGTNGATGATGPTGATGAAGTNGATGATGPTGAAGTNGTNGTNGATGATGPTGSAGAAGATGATGATGPSWTITSNNFNTDGSQSIVTTVPSTVTSTNMAWLLGGNATTALRQMGATGAQPVNFITNNVERYRMHANGQITVNNTTAGTGDLFAVYGSGYTGAIQSTANINDWPINGYSTGAFGSVYGENTGTGVGVYGSAAGATSGNGVYGVSGGTNAGSNGVFGNYVGAGANGIGVYGQGNNGTAVYGYANGTGDGTIGQAQNAGAFGVWGINTNATGTGIVGGGTNSTSYYLVNGTGGAFSGKTIGVYGRVVQDSIVAGVMKAGGYFYSNVSAYAYVGAVTAANVIRKIEGLGTVNTTVKDLNGKQVVLSAPEAPENLFEDYGTGQLMNGQAHITLDPVFAKNIVVNDKHPLRVFIQPEGDCNGVYVTNKDGNGFDVKELTNGQSNVKFSWHVVANRADEVLHDGSVSRYSEERFAPAIGTQEFKAKETKMQTGQIVPDKK